MLGGGGRVAPQIAWRTLLRERWRTALSVLGVALATMLVILLQGFTAGIDQQLSAYLDHAPGSIVVAQAGVNSSYASSVLPPSALATVAATPGVSRTVPITAQLAVLDVPTGKQPVYLIGFDPGSGGGPWLESAGRPLRADDDIVVDSVFAARQGLNPGDGLTIMGHRFLVVGLSQGTQSWMISYAFLSRASLNALLGLPETAASFAFVSPAAATPASALTDRLAAVSGVNALPVATMIAQDRSTIGAPFEMVVQLMTVIAYGVGALVIGLVVYSATVEHRREYGVLKAVGSRSGRLYAVVATQSLAASVAGAVVGFGLAVGVGAAIMRAAPAYLLAIEPGAVLIALSAGVFMALLGALLPARVVARIAPAEAMRGAT